MEPVLSAAEGGARMYNPEVGRMLAMDARFPGAGVPWRDDQYGYAYNSPATFTDPSGNIPVDIDGNPAWFGDEPYRPPSLVVAPPPGPVESQVMTPHDVHKLLVSLDVDRVTAYCTAYSPQWAACGGSWSVQPQVCSIDNQAGCMRYDYSHGPFEMAAEALLKAAGNPKQATKDAAKALSSECAQGWFSLGAAVLVASAVGASGIVFVSSGSVVTGSATTAVGSGLVGAGIATGPVPGETLLQLGQFTASAISGVR